MSLIAPLHLNYLNLFRPCEKGHLQLQYLIQYKSIQSVWLSNWFIVYCFTLIYVVCSGSIERNVKSKLCSLYLTFNHLLLSISAIVCLSYTPANSCSIFFPILIRLLIKEQPCEPVSSGLNWHSTSVSNSKKKGHLYRLPYLQFSLSFSFQFFFSISHRAHLF